MVALEIEDHPDRRRVADQRAVALVGLDDEQVRGSGEGVSRQTLRLEERQIATGDDGRLETRAPQDLEHHRGHRRLAARAGDGDRAMGCDEMREELRAMDDGHAKLARPRHVGHMILDRGRDHERGAIGADPAPVLRVDGDVERLELCTETPAFAAIEGPVAAARSAAGHRLELRERAHAGPGKPRIVEAAAPLRIGKNPRRRGRDEDEIPLAHALE